MSIKTYVPLKPSCATAVTSLALTVGKALMNAPVQTSYFNKVFPTAVTRQELDSWKIKEAGGWKSFAFFSGKKCINFELQAIMSE